MLNYENVLTAVLFIPAIYTWKSLFSTYKNLQREYEEESLFYKRHNCVVMHSKNLIRGWPTTDTIKITKSNLNSLMEPYLYFISTAKQNMDIAVMSFGLNLFFNAVNEVARRGIQVRVMLNLLSVKHEIQSIKELAKTGVKFAFYVDKTEQLNSIMHCKYMIKDYKKGNGYLCMGSMNFSSIDTMLNNFEDVTFTSNSSLVEHFHHYFNQCWDMIVTANNEPYNRTVLLQHGLL